MGTIDAVKAGIWAFLDDLFGEHVVTIDEKRINEEDRRARRRGLDDDVDYRKRVKRRMLKGLTASEMAPLFDRDVALRRRRKRRTSGNVVRFLAGGRR